MSSVAEDFCFSNTFGHEESELLVDDALLMELLDQATDLDVREEDDFTLILRSLESEIQPAVSPEEAGDGVLLPRPVDSEMDDHIILLDDRDARHECSSAASSTFSGADDPGNWWAEMELEETSPAWIGEWYVDDCGQSVSVHSSLYCVAAGDCMEQDYTTTLWD